MDIVVILKLSLNSTRSRSNEIMKVYHFLLLILCSFLMNLSGFSQQDILLFQEDFNLGNSTFKLNSGGPSTASGSNKWIVNKNYNGYSVYPNTTKQDNTYSGTIAGAPASNYLHIHDETELSTSNCNYNNAIASDNFAFMTSGFCTVGLSDIKFTFFYLAEGTSTDFGSVYYSIDGGTNWIQCGAMQYNNETRWKYEVITDPAFENQQDLLFGFRWSNSSNGGIKKISFGVDDIIAVGTYDTNNPVRIKCSPSLTSACEGASLRLNISLSSPLCAGSYTVQLSDANGSFTNPQQWSISMGSSDTSRTVQLTMPNTSGGCYRFRVNRIEQPTIQGEESICISLTDCPNTLKTLKPVVTYGPDTTCVNSVIDVPFYSTGAFNNSNLYIAQLSDANGSFANPQTLGTLPSSKTFDPSLGSLPGSVPGLIPDTPPGCNYYIRVISTSPSVTPSITEYFGPFCLRQCDIKTNNTKDVSVCITPDVGKDTSIVFQINSFNNNVTYGVGNQFKVQVIKSNSYQIINTGILGTVTASTNSTLTLAVPGLKNLIPILGAPGTGTYYMRIVPTNASSTFDNLGTLVRLTIGSPYQLPLNLIPDDTLICSGEIVGIFYNPRNPRSTYQWYSPTFNNNQPFYWSSNPLNVQFSSAPAGKYTFTVRENNFGCFNPWSDTIGIHVNTIPNVNITSPSPICIGDTVDFQVQYQPATYYEWDAIKGNILDVSNNIIKMLYDTVGVFQIHVSALNQCGSNQNTRSINVRELPDVAAGNDIVICEDLLVTLEASSLSGTSFSWSSLNAVPLGNKNTLTLIPDSTTDYIVTAFNTYGCKNKDTVNVKVVENPHAVVTFIQSDTLGCTPFSTTLTNTTVNAVECLWSISNGQVINGCGPLSVNFSNPGCYDITLTTKDSNQCASSVTVDDMICAESPPTAKFSSSQSMLSIDDTDVQFYNESSGATSYEWSFGSDNQIYLDENPNYKFMYDENADYSVKLVAISSIGCRDSIYSLINVKEELIFYIPNTFSPNEDEYNQTFKPVFSSGIDPQNYALYIYNRWGELIFESRDVDVGWDGSYGTSTKSDFAVKVCDDGTYTWKIEYTFSEDNSRKSLTGYVNLLR